MTARSIRIQPDGALEGLQVIGFHGEVLDDETPARCGAVYADESGRLARIVEIGEEVSIELSDEALASDAPLPGMGTRVGPWPARLGHVVIAIGPEELSRLQAIKNRPARREPVRVQAFLDWVEGRREPLGLLAERKGELVFWYCKEDEGFAFWKRIHDVAEEEFFRAAKSGTKDELENASFWLARAMVDDQDIYLAAAGLGRAASPDWEALLVELLPTRSDAERKHGLEQAEQLIDRPPRFKPEPSNPTPHHAARSRLRSRYCVPGLPEAA